MRHALITAVMSSLALMAEANKSWAQVGPTGPGDAGAVLKDPFAIPATPARSAPPSQRSYVEGLLDKSTPPAAASAKNTLAEKLAALAPSAANNLNDDIKIKETDGPFVIYIQSYIGDDSHQHARQLAFELRNAYKLNAFTFNKGAEEKQKEHERIMAEIAKKRELYRQRGITADVPIRIGFMNIQEQCAVILGGYKSEEAARRALDGIRKLKPLDPSRVMLDKLYSGEMKRDGAGPATLYSKTDKMEEGYVNPFLGAFVGHNPTIKQKRPAEWDKLDMPLLRKLNAGEPFSLLSCKKAYTLAVKDFQTPNLLQTKSSTSSFLGSLTGGGKLGAREDRAAINAHNLAEVLRKNHLETYVLHAKYCSVVCIGSFDRPDDPALQSMANLIETKILPHIAQWFPPPPNQPVVHAKAVLMPVPH